MITNRVFICPNYKWGVIGFNAIRVYGQPSSFWIMTDRFVKKMDSELVDRTNAEIACSINTA